MTLRRIYWVAFLLYRWFSLRQLHCDDRHKSVSKRNASDTDRMKGETMPCLSEWALQSLQVAYPPCDVVFKQIYSQ